MQTRGKVDIPEGKKKDKKMLFLQNIVSNVKKIWNFQFFHYEFRPYTAEIRCIIELRDRKTELEIYFNC